MEKPKQLVEPDLANLRKACQNYIDDLEDSIDDEDATHYIYEIAMKTIFGKDVFKYINSHS